MQSTVHWNACGKLKVHYQLSWVTEQVLFIKGVYMLHAKDGNISVSVDVLYWELIPARRHQRSCAQAWPSNLPWQGMFCWSLHYFIGQATSFMIIYPMIMGLHFIECYCQSGKVKQAVLKEAQPEWIKRNGYKSIRVPQASQDSVLFGEPYTHMMVYCHQHQIPVSV